MIASMDVATLMWACTACIQSDSGCMGSPHKTMGEVVMSNNWCSVDFPQSGNIRHFHKLSM